MLLGLAVLGAVSPPRAEAQLAEIAEKELVPLLKKGLTKAAKEVQIQGGLNLAKAIVDEGIAGKPKLSNGAFLVKTKKGSTYKVTAKKSSGKFVINITKDTSSQGKPVKGKNPRGHSSKDQ
jgi:hypothetical protein